MPYKEFPEVIMFDIFERFVFGEEGVFLFVDFFFKTFYFIAPEYPVNNFFNYIYIFFLKIVIIKKK